ncbi:MAG: FtsX-like permease family protein [Gammaproteobacteria bacterium]|uniref:ABC transporter permease n=1 Tax=Rhodoferax sp. TaxID=50421 RepID=UPI0017EC68FF|nr:FtsX-like permease family protein [Rhodoferax sp.]MBU3899597.1 FtsX-like permease family protein [Gammaproteobacteria bacterium]MBA3056603.1 ABC transporter permease [Rhodoferax sp.]MBU3998928.1 FtsX-like permease family protein [Gammaproteobacteria bacterium]MBU4018073.1 FtsX-like permease family protein [Gammaproteobacteria bacterium]MBU4080236.1 FtsX-like permease family protein [Gammaproteobacteria bacterium]
MALRLPFAALVCLRYLREGRMQTVLILAGVTGGVAVIIFLTTLISQLQASIIDRTLGSQAHIVLKPPLLANRTLLPPGSTAAIVQPRAQRLRSIDQWEAVAQLASQTNGVLAVSPKLSGAAFAARADASQAITLLGVDAQAYQRIVQMPKYLRLGRFDVSGANAVIGVELAKDLGVTVGDKLRLIAMDGRNDLATIAGIFDIGNRDLNKRWVYTSIKLAQSLLDLPGGITEIDLRVMDLFQAETTARQLAAQTGLVADSWMQTNAQLLTALNSQSMSNNLIRFFVTVIVAVGIASVLVVSVVQKQKEIGILRAMGASPRRIMAVFLLQGGIYGGVGSALGVGLSLALLQFFSRITRNADGSLLVSPELDLSVVLGACALALLVGLLAAALPARRAARLDPVQAIRV